MAARGQTVFYPPQSEAAGFNPQERPMCTKCNATSKHTKAACCTSSGSKNSQEQKDPCYVYCDGGPGKNNVCSKSQAYCNIGKQIIVDHGNVNNFPGHACQSSNQTIAKGWTAAFWNALVDELATAEGLGHVQKQGATANPYVASNQVITAALYNTMVAKFNHFQGVVGGVGVNQVIYGTHASVLETKYPRLAFAWSVCDICNGAAQGYGYCDCNCPCSCSCNCGCACPCACSCSSPCNCSCNCSSR